MISARRSLLVLALGLGVLAVPSEAEALTWSEKRTMIRQAFADYRVAAEPFRTTVSDAGKAFFDAVKTELALSDADAWRARWKLGSAYFRAKRAFAALPDADQTADNLKALLLAELQTAFGELTQDAAQLAALTAHAQTFVDAAAPAIVQLDALRDALRTQIRTILSS